VDIDVTHVIFYPRHSLPVFAYSKLAVGMSWERGYSTFTPKYMYILLF